MVERRLPEVGPPSGRVPGRGLLVLPISEARRRRNRGEIANKGSVLEGFVSRRIYRQRGATRGGLGAPRAPPGAARGGAGPGGRLGPLAPPWPLSGSSRSFLHADFLSEFSRIFGALFIWGKPEIEKQQKTGTDTGVH